MVPTALATGLPITAADQRRLDALHADLKKACALVDFHYAKKHVEEFEAATERVDHVNRLIQRGEFAGRW